MGMDGMKLNSRKSLFTFVLLGIVLVLFLSPPTQAQTVVVDLFSDRSRKRLGKSARKALIKALDRRGLRLVPHSKYVRTGRSLRIRGADMGRATAIRKIAPRLRLNGVITGEAKRVRGRYQLTLRLRGSRGRVLIKKVFRSRKASFSRQKANFMAGLVVSKLRGKAPRRSGSPAANAAPPRVEEVPARGRPAAGNSSVPAWARVDGDGGPASPNPTAPPSARRTVRSRRGAPATVADLILQTGPSFHFRDGLKPPHSAQLVPGMRVNSHFFLANFLGSSALGNLGLAGMVDLTFGQEYKFSSGSDEVWTTTQLQWQAEVVYRLETDWPLRPAFLARAGFGSLNNSHDSDSSLVKSVSYTGAYLAADLWLTLHRNLRAGLSAGFLIPGSAGEDLDASFWGLTAFAGLESCFFDMLTVGLGYDLSRYWIDDQNMGAVNDTYQTVILRVGYRTR